MSPSESKNVALQDALQAHMEYDQKERLCHDGPDWCMAGVLKSLQPAVDGPVDVAAGIALWPAYLGMRLWMGVWLAIPYLFGLRMRVTVVDGVARARLIRRSPAMHRR